MNKAELIADVAIKASVTQAAVKAVINATTEVITDAVANSEEVRFAGLFNLKVVAKPARTCRNPITGAEVAVPAKKAVKIKAAKELTDEANRK